MAYEIGESGGMDEEQETKPTSTPQQQQQQQQQQQGARPSTASPPTGALKPTGDRRAAAGGRDREHRRGRAARRAHRRARAAHGGPGARRAAARVQSAPVAPQQQQQAGAGAAAGLGKPTLVPIDGRALESKLLPVQVSLFRGPERGRPGLGAPSRGKNRPPRPPGLKGMRRDSDEESLGNDSQEDEPQISAEAQEQAIQTLEMRCASPTPHTVAFSSNE